MKNNLTRISRVQATTPSLGAAGKKSQQDLTVTQDTNERILLLRSQCEKSRRAGETSHFIFKDDVSKKAELRCRGTKMKTKSRTKGKTVYENQQLRLQR